MRIESTEPVEVRTQDGWIINVRRRPWADATELWIGKVEMGKFFVASIKDGQLELKETKEGVSNEEPTLIVNAMVWEGLSRALRGVTPQIDVKEVDAELNATKYHLEDMRLLVFKKKGESK